MCFSVADWFRTEARTSRRTFLRCGLMAGVAAISFEYGRSHALAGVAEGAEPPPPVALTGARIYPGPDAPPIPRGVVLTSGKAIVAVGSQEQVSIPSDAKTLDCTGLVVTAGFTNCHVHFTEAKWQAADSATATHLAGALSAMLTRYGFVRVVDTGSWLPNTRGLGHRVDGANVLGPQIITAGPNFVPPAGTPFYLQPARLPELTDPGTAETLIEQALDAGVDVVKLFTGSFARQDSIAIMPVDVVRAATARAHERGKLVLAHPSNGAGARAALDGGVDILAHTFPSELTGPWDRSLPVRMREAGMALIPTLKLWRYEAQRLGRAPAIAEGARVNAAAQVKAFTDAGGQLLFGTDVGYMTDYDPTDEYVLLERAGLSFQQILAALTTEPASRFGRSAHSGRVAPGMDAELVVLDGDPDRDIAALARVRYVLQQGRIIYSGTLSG
jgi:imidazolonepropionase-like amidohydrolase